MQGLILVTFYLKPNKNNTYREELKLKYSEVIVRSFLVERAGSFQKKKY